MKLGQEFVERENALSAAVDAVQAAAVVFLETGGRSRAARELDEIVETLMTIRGEEIVRHREFAIKVSESGF